MTNTNIFKSYIETITLKLSALSFKPLALSLKLFLIALAFAACNTKHDHKEEASKDQSYTCPMHPQVVSEKQGSCPVCGMDLVPVQKGGETAELILSEAQIALANIKTQKIKQEETGKSTLLTGRLVVNEEQTQMITSRVEGRIERLFIKEVGQKINKGEEVYEIYSDQLLTLQNEYLLAYQQAQEFKENERYQSFMQVAERKLILLGMTKSQLQYILNTKTPNARVTFRSPYSGVAGEVLSAEGSYVAEGTPILRIEELDKIWIEAELYPNETKLVKQGDIISVTIPAFGNELIKAKVSFLSPAYREGTQIVTLRAGIDNKQGQLIAGMQANVVLTSSGKKSLALPTDAVIRDEKSRHVWVETKKGVFKPRIVKTGVENFDKIEILEGLQENENVVVSGAYLLYSEFVLKKGGDPAEAAKLEEASLQLSDSKEQKAQTPASTIITDKATDDEISKVLAEYLKIKDALVGSNAQDAISAASKASKILTSTNSSSSYIKSQKKLKEELVALNRGFKTIAATADLDKQRAEFAVLSERLYGMLKELKVPRQEIYYQYCPMSLDNEGAYWLSSTKEILNPYFGEKMLKCGSTKEVLSQK